MTPNEGGLSKSASAPRSLEEAAGGQQAGSLLRAAAMLRAIAAGGRAGISLADLAHKTKLPRPTVYRVAEMLEELGWVERDPSEKRLFLGADLALLGFSAQARHSTDAIVRPLLEELTREIGQTVYLAVRSGDDSVCIARCESQTLIKTLVLDVGSRQPLGVGAGSMAMLAALSDAEVERVIERNHERYHERVPFDEASFRNCLKLARTSGYATHEGLFTRGVSGIGVVVRDISGGAIASISVAFITDWLDESEREHCVKSIQATARKVAVRLTGFPRSA